MNDTVFGLIPFLALITISDEVPSVFAMLTVVDVYCSVSDVDFTLADEIPTPFVPLGPSVYIISEDRAHSYRTSPVAYTRL